MKNNIITEIKELEVLFVCAMNRILQNCFFYVKASAFRFVRVVLWIYGKEREKENWWFLNKIEFIWKRFIVEKIDNTVTQNCLYKTLFLIENPNFQKKKIENLE